MEEAKRLSIHLVAWNRAAHLSDLMHSLEQQDCQDFQTVVVDNASADGLAEWVRQTYPNAIAVRNFHPQGFARLHNQAIALALSRWSPTVWSDRFIAFVHPGVILAPEALTQLMRTLVSHPDLMIAGPCLFQASLAPSDDVEQSELIFSDTLESAGWSMKKTRRVFDRTKDAPVFGFSGACVVMRASALAALKLGGEWLDEDMGEVSALMDLMWRARGQGMRTEIVEQAKAWHLPHTSFEKEANQPVLTGERLWLITKNDSLVNMLIHLPWVAADVVRSLFISLIFPRAAWAWMLAWIRVPKMVRKRMELRRSARVRSKDVRALFV